MAVDVDALSRRAASLYRASRFEAALQAYREVLAIDPDRPDDWLNLGLLSRQAGCAHDALAAYDRALEAGVCNPEEVHLNRAVVLSDDLLDAPAARASLESALAINPDFVPALLNLGNLFEDEGDRKAA
ncbi:MAG: tetratricopeptide repeat protein, partial [Pseudomonadota bacterium]|nr:tetratricopeptide repeat protein [Pseudomonadota bacterium]